VLDAKSLVEVPLASSESRELDRSWLLDRQIGGLGAFENFVDVHGSLAKKVRIDRGARHQPAFVDKPARHGNRWHAVLQRQFGGALARQRLLSSPVPRA
jgi:hypothetical protein